MANNKKGIKHNEGLFKKNLIQALRSNKAFAEEVVDMIYDIFIALDSSNFTPTTFIQKLRDIEKDKGQKNSITDLRKVKYYVLNVLKKSEEKGITENFDIVVDQDEFEDSDYTEVDSTKKRDPLNKEKDSKLDITMDSITVSNRSDLETTGHYADTDSSENYFPHGDGLFEYTDKLNGECPICSTSGKLFRTISQDYGECKECDKLVSIKDIKVKKNKD